MTHGGQSSEAVVTARCGLHSFTGTTEHTKGWAGAREEMFLIVTTRFSETGRLTKRICRQIILESYNSLSIFKNWNFQLQAPRNSVSCQSLRGSHTLPGLVLQKSLTVYKAGRL